MNVCMGNKGRLPRANQIAETDEGDGGGQAQQEGCPSSYARNDTLDGISCALTEVNKCLKAEKLKIVDYHGLRTYTPCNSFKQKL